MVWKPTTRQLEIIADLGHVRTSSARIAEALGIEEAEFRAWTCRLVATREPVEIPALPVKQSWAHEQLANLKYGQRKIASPIGERAVISRGDSAPQCWQAQR